MNKGTYFTIGLVLVSLSAPVLAVDGVIEINQVRALAGGVTTGDVADFPVTIDQSGSYRLTGDLTVPTDTHGIAITASDVTLDLNGFGIFSAGGSEFAAGVYAKADCIENVEVRNGTIRGFPADGFRMAGVPTCTARFCRAVDLRAVYNGQDGIHFTCFSGLIEGCTASSNGDEGVEAGATSLVRGGLFFDNDGYGIQFSAGSNGGYAECALNGNNGGGAQVLFGYELGGNFCGTDSTCP